MIALSRAVLISRWQSFQSISVLLSKDNNLNLRFLHSKILMRFMLLMLVVSGCVQSASIIIVRAARATGRLKLDLERKGWFVSVLRVSIRGCSSAGRAPDLHSGGRRFDPDQLHQFCDNQCLIGPIAQLARAHP